ncbi:MAG: hypothetical protein RR485_04945 [Mucinivorans sp.]
MKRFLLIISVVWLGSLSLFSQEITKDVQRNFANYTPSEKCYLQIDKPNYFVGDSVWFKGYLVNSADHSAALSNYIYIDVIDTSDTIVVRGKIKRDSIGVGFSGYLPLGKKIVAGRYTIRAYTLWMRNFPREYFFYKQITVSEPFTFGSKMRAEVRNVDSTFVFILSLGGDRYSNIDLDCNIRNLTTNKQIRTRDEKSNEKGFVKLPVKGLAPGDVVAIDVKGKVGKSRFRNSLQLEIPNADYDIQFLPEGGDLISGNVRRVAYKAVSSSGNPIDVSGYVLNDIGDTVSGFKSVKDGMGLVEFYVDSSRRYTAYCWSRDSIFKQIPLAAVKKDGVALAMINREGKISYTVEKVGTFADRKMYALLHTRGRMQYIMPLDRPYARHTIPLNLLAAGVSHLMIIDQDRTPLAERLFFVQPLLPEILVTSDQTSYGSRQPIILDLALPDTVRGNFAISVTSDNLVNHPDDYDNIVSSLLLTSDLHSPIDRPASYIGSSDVDLLMLTNGWRRFDVKDIVCGVEQHMPYYLEAGQLITGAVKSGYAKNLRDANVFAQIVTTDSTRIAKVGLDNRFEIGDLDISGTKQISLKVVHPKNRTLNATILVDSLPEPEPPFVAKRVSSLDSFSPMFQDSVTQAMNTMLSGSELGVYQTLSIDPVVVSARGKASPSKLDQAREADIAPNRLSSKLSYYSSPFNRYMKDINPDLSLQQLIKYSGMIPDPLSEYTFVIDGMEFHVDQSPNALETLPPYRGNEITAIEYITIPRCYTYNRNNTIFVIETKYNNPYAYWNSVVKDITVLDFVGYDKCEKVFYSPKYTTKREKYDSEDYRSTIYWNPNVNLSNKTQRLQFYSSDESHCSYTITIEGLTNRNDPVYQTQKLIIR